MAQRQPTPGDAVLLAIDIAKTRNEASIELPGGGRRRRLTVLNTRADHDRFIGTLTGYGARVIVGFEASGNYHRALA